MSIGHESGGIDVSVMKALGLACLLFLATSAGADTEVYKWVDEEGNVHYGDRPPEDVESERLNIEAEAPSLSAEEQSRYLEEAQERAKRRAEDRRARAAAEQVAEEERPARQRRCVYARKQLISLQQQLPVYRDEEGTFRTLSRYDAYEGEREYLGNV